MGDWYGDSARLAAPVADHLWQSTVFALLAVCVARLLKKNAARLRFRLWLLASVKFLLPFALLVHLGHDLGAQLIPAPPGGFTFALVQVGQPFGGAHPHLLPATSRDASSLPALLALLWIAGAAATLVVWWWRWRKVFRVRRAAQPLQQGVEVERMRLLERTTGLRAVPILLLKSHVEPGLFGIFRPVLLWPDGMAKQLDERQLTAILAHELWHARRLDNATAALQMLVQTVFWFHPLVWRLGARQMVERELACDEGVLALGIEPAAYAESILQICRLCVETPRSCVAGVRGSNLKQRIKHIMKQQTVASLSTRRKALLSTLAIATVVAPLLLGAVSSRGLAQAATPGSSPGPVHVTSLTRDITGGMMTRISHTANGTSITNSTLRGLVELAYGLEDYQLTGGPVWITQDRFDLTYTGGGSSHGPENMVYRAALKDILAQQFHLVLTQQTKPGQVFALVIAPSGVKFGAATPPKAPGTEEPLLTVRTRVEHSQGQITITGGPGGLADALSAQIGHPVIDKTGLTGIYAINFHWSSSSASADALSEELRQQLGLSLVPEVRAVQTSVIDSVTVPAAS